uniref:uncharacterized protein LOC105351335 n=1 Tax=Fragaria vesca subsp. vesca TaxID=101020 RepID=UPI0005CA564F|nr:PREDICTED: uncharacterized protein LOC105351335 [Fragaria vesca subsp. vesca]
MATSEKEKKLVEWNSKGQPVGEVSRKFSSTMGVIVREQVPIVFDSWHGVKDPARNTLWELLMQKYIVDVCFKGFVLQQMGKLWRSWKSELSVEIRKILEAKSTKTERTNLLTKLKPQDVSTMEWDQFVKERMSDKWLAKSMKMREIRAKQTLTHTMSQKGYARTEDEHNKQHPDKPLTKPQLWITAHVSKKKTSEANAAKIAPPNDDGEDILTQILDKERNGRIRGLREGVTKTKLYAQSQSDARYQKIEAQLNAVTAKYTKLENILASKLGINLEDDDASGEDAPGISKNKAQCDGSVTREPTATPMFGGFGCFWQIAIGFWHEIGRGFWQIARGFWHEDLIIAFVSYENGVRSIFGFMLCVGYKFVNGFI